MRFIDHAPVLSDFLADSAASLTQQPPRLHSKHLYDASGSQLFDAITRVDEYYLTRVERSIFDANRAEIADRCGPGVRIVELGAGLGDKTHRLLSSLHEPAALVLIDISKEALLLGAGKLSEAFATLQITAICADYEQSIALDSHPARSVVFFPGSTIGNFTRTGAIAFLRRNAELVGTGGGLLLGADLVKDPAVMESAYDDAEGVTAAFNLNLLDRLAEAGATADRAAFTHRSTWVPGKERIEMHLVATQDTSLQVLDTQVNLGQGEHIVSEYCHKYTNASLRGLLDEAGWTLEETWTDVGERFAVVWATVK